MLFEFGDFALDDTNLDLRRAGNPVPLEPRVLDLLLLLVRNRHRLVTKQEILDRIWEGRIVSGASLSVAMTALRRALRDDHTSPTFIATHHGRGYRFVAPTRTTRAGPATDASRNATRPFVGRGPELQQLQRALLATSSGASLALVSGEPGIGKTSLSTHFCELLDDRTPVVIRCPHEEGAPAFWLWALTLRTCAHALPSSFRQFISKAEHSALHDLVPDLFPLHRRSEERRLLDHQQRRIELFEEITRAINHATNSTGVVLVLDDIHLADEPSVSLLSHILEAPITGPLLILATARTSGPFRAAAFPRIWDNLRRHPRTVDVSLGALNESESRDLLEEIAGKGLAATTVDAVIAKAAGNPFFLTSIARHLGTATHPKPHPPLIPDDLVAAVTHDLSHLPASTRASLTAASVIGVEFSLLLLARAQASSPESVARDLEPALSSWVIAHSPRPGRFRFAHAIVREALYRTIQPLARAHVHRSIAEALEEEPSSQGEGLALIAHHYFESSLGSPSIDAVRFSIRAGDWAEARCVYEDAADHYARALELLPVTASDEDRCSLLIKIATQQVRLGDRVTAKRSFERAVAIARSKESAQLLGQAALGIAPGVLSIETGVVDLSLIDILDQALAMSRLADPGLAAKLAARLSLALHWSDDDGTTKELLELAESLAQIAGDKASQVHAAHARWFSSRNPGSRCKRLTIARRLCREVRRVEERELELTCRLFLMNSLLESGEVVSFDSELQRYTESATRLRQPQGLWYVAMLNGMRALMRGDLASACRHQEEFSTRASRAGDANAVHSALAHALLIAYEDDRLEEVLQPLDDIVAAYPSVRGWRATR